MRAASHAIAAGVLARRLVLLLGASLHVTCSEAPRVAQAQSLEEVEAQAAALLEQRRSAIASNDTRSLGRCFDFGTLQDRMRAFGDELGGYARIGRLGMRVGLLESIRTKEAPTEIEVLGTRPLSEAEGSGWGVLARERGPSGTRHTEYRVHFDGGDLRIFDWAEADLLVPFSHLVAAELVVEEGHGSPALSSLMGIIGPAKLCSTPEEIESIVARLESADAAELPRGLAAFRACIRARLEIDRERWEEALAHLERAEALWPRMPIVHFHRARCYLATDRPELALQEARLYLDRLGPQALTYELIGAALEALGEPEEAAEAFHAGLEDDLRNDPCLLGLARVLEDDVQVRRHFAAREDAAAAFEGLVTELLDSGHPAAVEALALELERIAPRDPNAGYYRARVHLERGEPGEALDRLEEVLVAAAETDELEAYLELYVRALLDADTPLDRYLGTPDPLFVFDALGTWLAPEGDAERLLRLVEIQREAHPEDPWLEYYAGVAHRIAGDVERAACAFEAGHARFVSRAPDDEQRATYRWNWTDALHDLGRALEAYERAAPREATFEQLVQRALREHDGALLAQLVERRADDRPDDPELALLAGCAALHEGDPMAALAELEAGLERTPRGRWSGWAEEAFVLAWLRLEEPERALTEARRLTEADEAPWLEGLVQALRGDAPRAIEALEACLLFGFAPEDVFLDPSLEALLATAPYAAFREDWWWEE